MISFNGSFLKYYVSYQISTLKPASICIGPSLGSTYVHISCPKDLKHCFDFIHLNNMIRLLNLSDNLFHKLFLNSIV